MLKLASPGFKTWHLLTLKNNTNMSKFQLLKMQKEVWLQNLTFANGIKQCNFTLVLKIINSITGVSLEFEVAGQWNKVDSYWAAKPWTRALAPAHARGVRGHAPPEIFDKANSNRAMWCILGLFEGYIFLQKCSHFHIILQTFFKPRGRIDMWFVSARPC